MSSQSLTSPGPGPTSPSAATDFGRDATVSIVIPVHNERGNIRPLFKELQATISSEAMAGWLPVEVLWIEDESDDGTASLVDELATEHAHVSAIHLRRGWGQSAALSAGMDAATGDIVVPMDGDRQNDPADIPRLLTRVEDGADCVSGWRRDRDDPLSKRIPSRIQTWLAKKTGPDINDFGCTLTAYRAEALSAIDLRGETHRYLPAQLFDKGFDVREVEVNHRPRTEGESRYGLGRLVRGFVDLLFHWFWVRYGSRPMHLFGAVGLLLLGSGATIGAVSVVQRFAFAVPLAPRVPRLILIALSIMTGLLLLVFGVLSELLVKVLHRDNPEYRVKRVVA